MAIEPKDIGEIQKSLNDAAGKAAVLWTAFVTFNLYLVISFGSVTHRDLLFGNPVKLPVLNADLPLIGFFIVAPVLLLTFQVYVLLQLAALSQRAHVFNLLLANTITSPANAEYVRHRLDGFAILQFLSGPESQRAGGAGGAYRLIAWITLVGAPLLTLIQSQLMFLPYHSVLTTWLIRLCIAVELFTVWHFWPRLHPEDESYLKGMTRVDWRILGGLGSAAVVIFSWLIATVPGEVIDTYVPTLGLRSALFSAAPNEVDDRALFSNRIILTDQVLIDLEKIDKVPISFSLRGRDLRGAILKRNDLRKVDFTGAILDEAQLDGSRLNRAIFGCASSGSHFQCASLRKASLTLVDFTESYAESTYFDDANLDRSKLNNVNWSSASLKHAHMVDIVADGSMFRGADLSGATLLRAQFRNCDLREVVARKITAPDVNLGTSRLQGAIFDHAFMPRASLSRSSANAASFVSADLRGAVFSRATLFGTKLDDAQLQGSDLSKAGFEGSSMVRTNVAFSLLIQTRLQGINLAGADFTGALLQNSCVWGASGRPKLDLVEIQNLDETTVPWKSKFEQSFEHWLAYNSGDINDQLYRFLKRRLAGLEMIDTSRRPAVDAPGWKEAIAAQSSELFSEKMVDRLLKFVCDEPASSLNNQQIRLVRSNIFGQASLLTELARRRKDQSCVGLSSMEEQQWFDLESMLQLRLSNSGSGSVDWSNKSSCDQ